MSQTIIRNFEISDLECVSRFIAHLNAEPEHHIAYFGLQPEEVVYYLMEERTCPAEETCLLAYLRNKLIGVICVEYDLELRRAWYEGPLIDHPDWQEVADLLYEAAVEITPTCINDYELACDVCNTNLENLAQRHGYRSSGDAVCLIFLRLSLEQLPNIKERELQETYYDPFKALHDSIFPGTYYAGYQLVGLLDDSHKAFAITKGDQLLGYIYAYVIPKTGSAVIDFIGVVQTERGRGFGYRLLVTSLHWIFSVPEIREVVLTVDVENQPALRLYKKAGFIEQRILRGFRLKIDNRNSSPSNR